MDIKKMKQYTKYGDNYIADYLIGEGYEPNLLLTNWWEAFAFYLYHAFMRGRTDELSIRFCGNTIETLEKVLGDRLEEKTRNLKKVLADPNSLDRKLKAGGASNHKDREMVLDSLSFISKLGQYNIVKYSVKMIRSGRTFELYKRLDGLSQIGPKLASFFIRDVVLLYDLSGKLSTDDLTFVQPVDTWVLKAAKKVGIVDEKDGSDERTMRKIALKCKKLGIDPLKFNAGVWYYEWRQSRGKLGKTLKDWL